MINTLYLPELRELLAEGDAEELRQFCTAFHHPARTAEFMEGLTAEETWEVLKHAPEETRIEIFGYLDPKKQVEIVEKCDRAAISHLITELPPDDRVDLLNEVDALVVEEMLHLIPVEDRRDILRLGAYPEGTAGAVMTSEIPRLAETLTVGEAFDEIRKAAPEWETLYYIYLVDVENHLRGVITARQLLSNVGRPDQRIADLMEQNVYSVDASEDQERVADKVAQYDLHAIPVVDNEHRLLGIITHDDIIDVVREEAAEDAQRFAGVEPLEESYLDTDWITLFRKRLPWLVALLVAALLTVFALEHYESDFKKVTWLIFFIPLIISSGGNSGNQSATLIITAMTAGHMRMADFWRVLQRELSMGLALGTSLGLLSYCIAIFNVPSPIEALAIPITILLVVLCGTLCGAILPILFRRLGLDPALMSNPFVAGIIDILGILIYMAVAMVMVDELCDGSGGLQR